MTRSETMPGTLRSVSLVAAAVMFFLVRALPEGSNQECAANDGAGGDACPPEIDEVGLLQRAREKGPALEVTLSRGSCTGGNNDPYAGGYKPCCEGLQKCLGDWHDTSTWSYLCLSSCGHEPGPPPQPPVGEGLSTCPKPVSLKSRSSIWNVAVSSHSCQSSDGIRGDAGYACADSSGAVDWTSIYVDMESVGNKVGCFVWETDQCQYPMKSVKQIDFDVEWEGCDNLWMAPLWTFSSPWSPNTNRQGLSGEVDFVEECAVPSVNTNLGCYDAGQGSGCVDSQHWGRGSSSNGPQHMTMALDSEGNLEVQLCTMDKTSCRTVASYSRYLDIVYPTTDGRNNVYKFMSDVFNDHGGDGGWNGCRAVRNPSTTCKYAVRNIKIESNSNVPIFEDPNSKCYVLNSEASVATHRRAAMSLPSNFSQASQVSQVS